MANRTDPLAKSIRGTNPQNLVEKILRSKIYQNTFWKEQCFGLTVETLVDKAMELNHLDRTHGGNRKPTPFMCLVMKMLQIQPGKEIVVEFINNNDYKYVRVLGAFYLRLTGTDIDVYRHLEPLYNDYRLLRRKLSDGQFALTHVDEVTDELLTKDYSCDIALPRIKKRVRVVDREYERDYDSDRGRDRDRDREMDRDKDRKRYLERDYGREGRERDRRDRECGGRRRSYSRSRSRSRERDMKDRDRKDRDRDYDGEERCRRHARDNSTSPRRALEDEKPSKKKKEKEKKKDDGTDHPDPEIAEANRIHASLGPKPLKL